MQGSLVLASVTGPDTDIPLIISRNSGISLTSFCSRPLLGLLLSEGNYNQFSFGNFMKSLRKPENTLQCLGSTQVYGVKDEYPRLQMRLSSPKASFAVFPSLERVPPLSLAANHFSTHAQRANPQA